MSSVIELNSAYYVVDDLQQGYVQRISPAFRTTGVEQSTDDPSVNRYRHPSFPLGLGWQRQNRETGRGVGGLLDSTCWTALGPVTLGKLHVTQTHAANAEHFKKAINFKGDLWGLFEEDYNGSDASELCSRKYGATSDDWTGGGTISVISPDPDAIRGFDMVAHKGKLYALHNSNTAGTANSSLYGISSSVDGVTWADATGTGWPTGGIWVPIAIYQRNNFDDEGGRLLSFGNLLIMALHSNQGDDFINIFSTSDAAANWATDIVSQITSADGPKALVDWFSLTGARSPVLVTSEAIYSIDTVNDTFSVIHTLSGDTRNGRWASVGNDGALYVGLADGDVIRLSITDENELTVIHIGPPGDGLVTARAGHVNYILQTPSKWLLVAYGGHAANTNASIFMVDTQTIRIDPETGNQFMPWHSLWQDATANRDIIAMAYSTEDDNTARLHFAVEGAAASVNFHIEEPLTNPDQSTTISYQTTSILRLPVDDMGDPHTTTTVLNARVSADDLTAGSGGSGGATDEFITLRYGLDGASDTTTTLGDFLSGQLTQNFGASSQGVAALRIGLNLLFDRGSTATNTPKMREFEIRASHVLIDRKTWDFVVDIEKTAQGETKPSLVANTDVHETIITALQTVATSTTLVTCTVGGLAQTRVRVPPTALPQFSLLLMNSSKNRRGYRTGTVAMHVEEGN